MTCQFSSDDLPLPLYGHTTVYSTSANSIYMMGGYTSDDSPATAVYKWDQNHDASSSGWFASLGSIPDPEWDASGVQTMFAVADVLYVIGIDHAEHTVNRFDTVKNEWLPNGAEPPLDLTKGCVAYNGSHFVMIDGRNSKQETQYVRIQFYDIARNVWSMHTVEAPFYTDGVSAIHWRYQCCAFVNDKLYIFGGKIGDSTYLNGMWRYDTLSQQFMSIGALYHSCSHGTSVFDGFGHLYLVGCYSDSLGNGQDSNLIQVFDTNTERLAVAADMIYNQEAIDETAALIFNRSLWIFGGWNQGAKVVSDKVQICDISAFLPSTTETPSAEPTGIIFYPTPTAFPSSGKNQDTNLVLSILIIVLVALGCFGVAVLFYLRSRTKRNQQKAQQAKNGIHAQVMPQQVINHKPKHAVLSAQAQPIVVPQPAINHQPVVQVHIQPYQNPYPNPYPPWPSMQPYPNQFAAHEAVRPLPVPISAAAHVHPNPLNVRRAEAKFAYDPNRNYKKEGARASIITPTFHPNLADDDNKSDDEDDQTNTQQVRNNGGVHVRDTNQDRSVNTLFV